MVHNGEIIALDTPEAVAERSGGKRFRFVPSSPVREEDLRAIPGVTSVEKKEKYLTVTGTGDLSSSIICKLLEMGVKVSDIEATSGNLDEAFVSLARENEKIQESNK